MVHFLAHPLFLWILWLCVVPSFTISDVSRYPCRAFLLSIGVLAAFSWSSLVSLHIISGALRLRQPGWLWMCCILLLHAFLSTPFGVSSSWYSAGSMVVAVGQTKIKLTRWYRPYWEQICFSVCLYWRLFKLHFLTSTALWVVFSIVSSKLSVDVQQLLQSSAVLSTIGTV